MTEPEPDPRPSAGQALATSDNTIVVVVDGPEDTTRRPRRPNIPCNWPGRELPEHELPASAQPPSSPSPPPDQSKGKQPS